MERHMDYRKFKSINRRELLKLAPVVALGVVAGLRKYFLFYNTERQHQSLDYKTPQEVYEGQKTGGIRTLCAA